MKSRAYAARMIELQLIGGTDASDKEGNPYYGLCELRELLDYIYGGVPASDVERIANPNNMIENGLNEAERIRVEDALREVVYGVGDNG